jgi:hypothetical protein
MQYWNFKDFEQDDYALIHLGVIFWNQTPRYW